MVSRSPFNGDKAGLCEVFLNNVTNSLIYLLDVLDLLDNRDFILVDGPQVIINSACICSEAQFLY